MTYKEKIMLFALIVQLCLWASCSGSVEQPSFVSLYSDSVSSNSEIGNETAQDSTSPKLKSFSLGDQNVLAIVLSGDVKNLKAHAFRSSAMDKEIACVVERISESGEDVDEKTVAEDSELVVYKIRPSQIFEIGESFVIEGSVEGSGSSNLDFSLPFKGLNSKPAKLLFTELRLGEGKKHGYIRFKVIESGNLSGLTLCMPANTWAKATEYTFPVAKVEKGEKIAYHWYTPPDSPGVVDEVNDDVKCSDKHAHSDARDFWGNFKKFNPKKTNAIILKSAKNGPLQDAVLFVHPKDADWMHESVAAVAQEAVDAGLWFPDASPKGALIVNITSTKKIKRKNLSNLKHSALDWVRVADERK